MTKLRDLDAFGDDCMNFSNFTEEDMRILKNDLNWFLGRVYAITGGDWLEECVLNLDHVFIETRDYDSDSDRIKVPNEVFFSNQDLEVWRRELFKARQAEENRKLALERQEYEASMVKQDLELLARLKAKYPDAPTS